MPIYYLKLLLLIKKHSGGLGRGRFFYLIALILFCCSPVTSIKLSAPERVIKDVPFFPQEMYQCGPASLAGILNFWGVKISPAEIAREIYSREARGTLNMDLVFYAQKKGLQAHYYQGSLEDLQKNISAGIPLLVQVDYGFLVYEQPHFLIVIGYDSKGVIVNSGSARAKFIPFSSFLKSWKKANYWTLRITPQ